jgi:5-phospho-D-xylono-1,4-lactonase
MPAASIMTVLGPIAAEQFGPTDAHEHLFLSTPAQPGEHLDDLDRALTEVREGAATGLAAIVELTPIGLGRRPELLRGVSQATGVHIVAATGFHRDAHYPADHWAHDASPEALVERMLADLRDGMDGTDIRAGVIKAGASLDQITDPEHRRLLAAAEAARRTGIQVVVHTEAGTCGPQVVELLLGAGLPAHRLTLAHMDRNPDPALHAEICSAGVSLVYDTLGHLSHGPDDQRIELITAMVDAGHAKSLMLGLDLGRRSYHRAYGGEPGLRHLLGDFVPALRARVGDEVVHRLLVDNPARAFALAPVAESVG